MPEDVQLVSVCPDKHLALKPREGMSGNQRKLIPPSEYFRTAKLRWRLCWGGRSAADMGRLEPSIEMVLSQRMAAGLALIYCFPQILKRSFDTKLLKHVFH